MVGVVIDEDFLVGEGVVFRLVFWVGWVKICGIVWFFLDFI